MTPSNMQRKIRVTLFNHWKCLSSFVRVCHFYGILLHFSLQSLSFPNKPLLRNRVARLHEECWESHASLIQPYCEAASKDQFTSRKGNTTRRAISTRLANKAFVHMRRAILGAIPSCRITAVTRQSNMAFFLSCLTCQYTTLRTLYCRRFRRFDGILVISIDIFQNGYGLVDHVICSSISVKFGRWN